MLGRWIGLLVVGALAVAVLGYGYYGTESTQIRDERYQANDAVMGEFFRGGDGRIYVDVAAAVRDPVGQPLAVVVLRTDAQKLLFPILQTWPIPSPSAETVLVRREGEEVVFLNELRHRQGSALAIREAATRTDLVTVKAVLGTEGPTEGIDYRGVAVILITLLTLGGAGGVAAYYRKSQAAQFRGLYEALRENDQLLREAEAVGELGSFVFDMATDTFQSSANLDRVLGIGPDHPRTGEGWLQVVHPADRQELDDYSRRTVATRGHFDHQYRIVRRGDKAERWVHSRARIDYAPNGTPQRMVGIIQDISSARSAEHHRLSEDQRYQRQRNALIRLATSALPKDETSLTEAFQRLTEVAARTLEVDRVSIWRYNAQRTGIRCFDLYERTANRHSSRLEISAADNPAYFQALLEADVLAADDAHRDPRTREFAAGYLTPLGIASMMDSVIRLGGGVLGVLCCEDTGRMRRWSHDEQTFAVALANLAAMSLTGIESRPRRVD